MGVWLALTVGVFLMIVNGWDPDKFTKYGPSYLSGLGVTLLLVILSVVLGGLMSLPLAFARMSKNPVLSWIAYGYVYFFRGTPLLTQLFLVYYGLGSFSRRIEGLGPLVVLPRRLELRAPDLHAQHRRLPGRNPARRHRKRAARPA